MKLRTIDITKNVVLSVLTCGLYDIYWQKQQIDLVNALLRKQEFSFKKWLILTLITCGLYHLYHEYVMGRAIVKIQHKYGLPPSESLPAISLVTSLLSLGIITDAIQQKELNEIIRELYERKYGRKSAEE